MSGAGRVVLVTGGGRGIGRAIAVALGTTGARVALTYRSDDGAAAEAVAAVGAAGGHAVARRVDAADETAMAEAVAAFAHDLGPVEACVANAGLVRDRLVWDLSAADLDAVVTANLRATHATFRAVLPGMRARRRGALLAISSASAHVANPGQAAYAAAKAGVEALVRTIAREGAPLGIRANALVVGLVATDATATLTPRQRERALARVPLERMGTAAEVAAAAAWLLDDARSGYVTGVSLAVDGGLTA